MVPSVQLLESDSTCIIRNQRYVWPTFLNSMSHKVSVILNILASHFLTGEQMKREVLVATFLGHFTRLNLTFSEAGFKSIRGEYTKHWLHTNQQVTIVENEEGALRRIEMTVKGLTETGLLLAEDSYGSKFELSPDGNGFDFFSGLIRRKLPRVY